MGVKYAQPKEAARSAAMIAGVERVRPHCRTRTNRKATRVSTQACVLYLSLIFPVLLLLGDLVFTHKTK
jgi:hypothetical protein